MKGKALVAATMIGMLLAFGGCTQGVGPSPAKEAKVEVSVDEFMDTNRIARNIDVAKGGLLEVSLGSNPSTGFTWPEIALIADGSVLRQNGGGGFVESEGEGLVGASGYQTWTFEALEKGTTTLSMEYGRPWEGGEKGVWTFELTVTVK